MESEILQQILTELTNLKNEMDKRFDNLEQKQNQMADTLDTVRKSTLNTELVQYPKIQAALDGLAGVFEHNEQNDARLQTVEDKVERHDVEIYALKQAVG